MILENDALLLEEQSLKNPFPGLRAFEFHESDLFFGRDGQSDALILKLSKTHFLAVVGDSGSGKSSLVRAGLLPAIYGGLMGKAGSGWHIAILRPGNDPIGNLARALNEPGGLALDNHESRDIQTLVNLRHASLGLVDIVQQARLGPHENLLVLVDQFEELFRFTKISEDPEYSNDAALFVKLLLQAKTHPNVYIVLTMRSDYLGDCARFWDLPEAVNEGQYLIPRMTWEDRQKAIVGPIEVRGGKIAPSLVNELITDMGDNPNQLPILQHALMRIWEKWREEGDENAELNLGHYEKTGGMTGTLSLHADEAYNALGNEHLQEIAKKIFKCLTEKGLGEKESRRPTKLNEICLVTGAKKKEVIEVIETFRLEGRSFLMPPQNVVLKGSTSIDISHESLINGWEQLKQWVEEEANSARIYRRLVEDALASRRQERGELRNFRLHNTLEWRDKNQPNRAWACRYHKGFYETPNAPRKIKKARDRELFNIAMKFLDESEKARQRAAEEKERAAKEKERQQRREAKRAWMVAGACAVAVIITSLAFVIASTALKFGYRAVVNAQQLSLSNYRKKMNEARLSLEAGKWGETNQALNELPSPGIDDRGLEWYYVWRASHNELTTLRSHSAGISAVAFSPDYKFIATASDDRTVKIWDVPTNDEATHEVRLELKDHEGPVLSLSYSPDGTKLATGSNDGTVKIWDMTTGHLSKSLPRESADFVRAVAFSPESNTVVIGTNKGLVKIWDISTPRALEWPAKHTEYVSSVVFHRDGKTVVTGSADRVVLRDAQTGQVKGSLPHLGEQVLAVAISPEGRLIATGTREGYITLWDVDSRQVKERSPQLRSPVLSLAFINDQTIIAGNGDSTIKVWDRGKKTFATFKGHSNPVVGIAVSSDSKTVVTGSTDKTAKLWDLSAPTEEVKFLGHSDRAPLAFSPNSEHPLIASGKQDGTVALWDPKTKYEQDLRGSSTAPILAVAFSSDGRWLAGGSADATVKLWEVATGRQLNSLTGHELEVRAVAFSPKGNSLASAGDDGVVRLWDINTGKIIHNLVGHEKRITSLSFSTNGRLATGSDDNTVRLWDTATGRELKKLEHSREVLSVAFSANGKLLASGSSDNTAILWDVETGTAVTKFRLDAAVTSVAFSMDPENPRVVTADYNGSVRFWAWDTDVSFALATLRPNTADNVPPVRLLSLAFSSDGKTLATGKGDGSVELWRAASQEVKKQRDEIIPINQDSQTLFPWWFSYMRKFF